MRIRKSRISTDGTCGVQTDLQIDRICDHFEQSVKADEPLRISDLLHRIDPRSRPTLLRELVLVQLGHSPRDRRVEVLQRHLQQFSETEYRSVLFRILSDVQPLKDCSSAGRSDVAKNLACPDAWARRTIDSTRPTATNATSPVVTGGAVLNARFEIVDRLGTGGFADVYRAYDKRLHRIVALKVPRNSDLATTESEHRFLREARTAAGLDHPGIIKLYDVEYSDGRCFLVSAYVEGRSLAELISERRLPTRQSVRLVADMADALAHAHRRNIIHRDVKPSNVIVDTNEKPHLTDFGLARHEHDAVSLTSDGRILGTLAYMAPEQARGGAHYVDCRADIYSMGVILYELLTGELPLRGSPALLIQKIITQDPGPPSSVVDTVDRPLDTICLKCLEKSPRRRYQTAEALEADLRRWLAGQKVHARPGGLYYRAVRWQRQHRRLSIVLLGATLILVAATGFGVQRLRFQAQSNQRLVWSHVRTLRTASSALIPTLVESLSEHRHSIQEGLTDQLANATSPAERARLVLMLNDPQYPNLEFLCEYVVSADHTERIGFQSVVGQQHARVLPLFWQVLRDRSRHPEQRLAAADVLANFEHDSPLWSDVALELADLLADQPDPTLWLNSMPAVRGQIDAYLVAISHSDTDLARRRGAAVALAALWRDEPHRMAELVSASSPNNCAAVIDYVKKLVATSQVDADDLIRHLETARALSAGPCNTALALAALGRTKPVLQLLESRHDLSLKTELSCRLADTRDRRLMTTLLRQARSDTSRFHLLGAIGEMQWSDAAPEVAAELETQLREICHSEADVGVRLAAERITRTHFHEQLADFSPSLLGASLYQTSLGHLMVRIDDDAATYTDKKRHAFYLSSLEITLEQYRRFDPNFGPAKPTPSDLAAPVLGIEMPSAKRYCNWLSQQEGVNASEFCYDEAIAEDTLDIKNWDVIASKPGYRLPHLDEWSVACRGACKATFHFGDSAVYLDRYAWHYGNSSHVAHAVGRLRPNRYGLFDMLGNATELCHFPLSERPADSHPQVIYYAGASYTSTLSAETVPGVFTTITYAVPSGGFRVARSNQ